MIDRKLIMPLAVVCILVILALGLFFVLKYTYRVFEIENYSPDQERKIIIEETWSDTEISPISGLPCQDYTRRPLAVILAEDLVTRPLSGLEAADLVFEMSVITNEVTRLMAVYVCGWPEEIGSLRSARHDFIPLAMGLDAILAHWGGSHFALDDLDQGIMDNIDAMVNPFNAFYRQPGIPMPHNGFTSIERLINSAEKLGYRLENQFIGYPHYQTNYQSTQEPAKSLFIDYAYPFNVKYTYQPATNSYLRFRTDKPEIDSLSNQQIAAKNIVIMRAASRQIEGPYYNDVDVEGRGDCQVYQNGQVLDCQWKKDKSYSSSKLYFLDKDEQEIKFVPGQIWIEIVEPEQNIKWF